jgi:predicted dehydrogenase
MTTARVAILGAGAVVREFHLPALLDNPRARVVALGGARVESLRTLRDASGVERIVTDPDLIARDPSIDAVLVALPNALHAPVTTAMLRGGKHVLCEKPMALTAAEARQMASAAESAGRTLAVGHVWRFDADVRRLREVVRSGGLGTVRRAKGHSVVAGRGPAPGSWFVRPELSGGGALADVGVHAIDTISFLFDDRVGPVRVRAEVRNEATDFEVEDSATVVIDYDNGLTAEVEAGWFGTSVESPHGAVELFGTEGSARTLPWSYRRGGGDAPQPWQGEHIHLAMYAAQIDHFLDCVLQGRAPECGGRQGVRDMEVLEAAYRSARSGEAVELGAS